MMATFSLFKILACASVHPTEVSWEDKDLIEEGCKKLKTRAFTKIKQFPTSIWVTLIGSVHNIDIP